jgi:HK97 family phage prohead protease
MSIEHKSFDVEFKSFGDSGEVELYAAVFNNVDRVDDVILPGAFKNLDEFARDGWLGVNHDMSGMGHATIESATQDDRGLLLTAKFHSTAEAQALRTVVKERKDRGKSVKASIGYAVTDHAFEKREGRKVRLLKGLDIFEASIVNLPANPLAGVASVKSCGPDVLTLDALKALIDAETKAGRVLSRANHSRLKEWHGTLSAMADQVKEMVDAHDPDATADPAKSLDPPPEPSTDVMEIYFRRLADCAR